MKKFLVLIALFASASVAHACPVKKGYIANGVVKDVAKMTPLCSMNSSMKSLVPDAKWIEVWGTTNDKPGAAKLAYVLAALKEQGYKQVVSQKTDKGNVWRFDKGAKVITILMAVNNPLVFVAIAGK